MLYRQISVTTGSLSHHEIWVDQEMKGSWDENGSHRKWPRTFPLMSTHAHNKLCWLSALPFYFHLSLQFDFGGGILNKCICPEVQPLTMLYAIFSRKRYPFRIPSIQGHPMDLFLKISVLQAHFCWLGDVEEIIVLGRKVLLEKDNSECQRGFEV